MSTDSRVAETLRLVVAFREAVTASERAPTRGPLAIEASAAMDEAWGALSDRIVSMSAMISNVAASLAKRENEIDRLETEVARLTAELLEVRKKLNTPELHDFAAGVVLEAAHQRERWGAEHDAGKDPADWFWLLGYLGGKVLNALKAGDADKALHHTISSAAALANWHAAISGTNTSMRPGIDPVARGIDAAMTKEKP